MCGPRIAIPAPAYRPELKDAAEDCALRPPRCQGKKWTHLVGEGIRETNGWSLATNVHACPAELNGALRTCADLLVHHPASIVVDATRGTNGWSPAIPVPAWTPGSKDAAVSSVQTLLVRMKVGRTGLKARLGVRATTGSSASAPEETSFADHYWQRSAVQPQLIGPAVDASKVLRGWKIAILAVVWRAMLNVAARSCAAAWTAWVTRGPRANLGSRRTALALALEAWSAALP